MEYNWRVGWEGEGFCKCQDREGLQNGNLNCILEVEKAWQSLFSESPTLSGGFLGSGRADGSWGEGGCFLPLSYPSYSPPSGSATEI